MVKALGVGIVVGVVSAVLPCFATLKRWSLMGGAVSYAVLSGVVLVECSTLSASWGRESAALAHERGLAFLDAPVTGSKDAAQNGELHLFVGGDEATLERARPCWK